MPDNRLELYRKCLQLPVKTPFTGLSQTRRSQPNHMSRVSEGVGAGMPSASLTLKALLLLLANGSQALQNIPRLSSP